MSTMPRPHRSEKTRSPKPSTPSRTPRHEDGEQLRVLFEQVIDYAIFTLDPEGIVTTWNSGAERMKGYRAEEIIGRHFDTFYTDEDRARDHPRDELRLALQQGRYEEQGWRVRKDGTHFWANVTITALFDDDGRHIGFGKITRDFTDRREAEDSLRQSEERFRLLVESARDYAIFMLDAGGRVTTWNLGAERINGYAADEIRGKHFSVFYTPADVARRHPQEELAIAAVEGSYAEEGWRVRKDGSTFWASVVITALRDHYGRLTGFGKVTRDLSDQKRAEQDARRLLQAESARTIADRLHVVSTAFASAMSRNDVARVVFDRMLPALDVDSASLAVRDEATGELRLAWAQGYDDAALQRPEAVVLGPQTVLRQVAEARAPLFLEGREQVAAAFPGLPTLADCTLVMAFPLLIRGQVIGALALTSRRAGRVPSAADKTLALAFADQCALALDRGLLFEREVAAKARADVLANASLALARSLDVDAILHALVELLVPRLVDGCRVEVPSGGLGKQRAAGSLTDGAATEVFPLVSRAHALGSLTVTRARAPLADADRELLREIARRAGAAVENAQLYADVEQAVRIRDDFMSIAGHEVRTPLAALQLTLETMARAVAKDPALQAAPRLAERLRKARDNGDRLQRLVDELLDVSRLSAGRLSLETEELDLADVVADVVARLADDAARVDAPIELTAAEALRGHWDRLRLEQVITNLIANAMKYGRGAPIEVAVAREDGFAVIRVRDHGIGIPAEDQARIFERFERAVPARHYGGLGLGLWIARQVVEASGGTIAVESAAGQGAVFTVRLPLLLPEGGAHGVA